MSTGPFRAQKKEAVKIPAVDRLGPRGVVSRPMRNLLLIIHILAAGAWIGGSLYSAFAIPQQAAESGVARVLTMVQRLGTRYFGSAVGVLLVSGVGLVLLSDAFGWGSAFVLIGIGVIVADSIFEGAILGPAWKRMASGESSSADSFGRTVRRAAVVHVSLLVLAVWAMVVKPGL